MSVAMIKMQMPEAIEKREKKQMQEQGVCIRIQKPLASKCLLLKDMLER